MEAFAYFDERKDEVCDGRERALIELFLHISQNSGYIGAVPQELLANFAAGEVLQPPMGPCTERIIVKGANGIKYLEYCC